MRRTGLRVRGLLTAVAVGASLLTGVVGASSAAASDAGTFVSSINSARRAAGLAPLSSSGTLTSVARSWAASMAASHQLAHNPRLTSQVSGWKVLGENVGTGGSATAIHSAFMASAPHRANILSSRYSQVGVGVATGGGQLWVVEVFRLPAGASAPTVSKPASKPKPVSKPTSTSASSHRSTTTRSTQRKAVTRPVAKPTKKPAKKPAARPAAKPAQAPSRSTTAAPVAAQAPLTLAAVLEHARLAVTGSGDPVGAWAWLLHRLLGVRTAIGA
ncbi:MAG: CAP domain-containing protein [Angustibacter sp.]